MGRMTLLYEGKEKRLDLRENFPIFVKLVASFDKSRSKQVFIGHEDFY